VQVQAYLYKDTGSALKSIWMTSGLAGFYKGLAPTLLRDVPEVAIQFTVYEALRKGVQRGRQGEKKLQTYEHLVLGGAAGAVAAGFTMPLDLCAPSRFSVGESSSVASLCSLGAETVLWPGRRSIKTRVQCGASSASALLREVVREQGVQGLFVGVGPRVAQVRPRRHVLRSSQVARISMGIDLRSVLAEYSSRVCVADVHHVRLVLHTL